MRILRSSLLHRTTSFPAPPPDLSWLYHLYTLLTNITASLR
jgi:hypothetical protein